MTNQYLVNFHTHTTFCDGKSTPEEMVRAALDKGFSAIGFSGHVTTPFDLSYCMRDMEGYIAEISRLKEKYRGRIAVYLGIEEDALSLTDRSRYDYLIGSCHYVRVGDTYFSVDSGLEYWNRLLDALGNDAIQLADAYYRTFCDYIRARKPDIVGHFDLITKYEEQGDSHLLNDPRYNRLAEEYLAAMIREDLIFEVNAGAMLRGIRTTPYPAENLLRLLRQEEARIILSSDSHSAETVDGGLEEMKRYLFDLGFRKAYALTDEGFRPYSLF